MPREKKIYKPVDLTGVKRYSIRQRKNRTETKAFGKPLKKLTGVDFFESLPDFLKAADLNEFINLVIKARKGNRPFHMLLGAHTIKVGLSPVVIDLMELGIVTGLSFNGAGLIHDLELAFWGGTSEDVQLGLANGSFGMVRETGDMVAEVGALAANNDLGLGQAAGVFMSEKKPRYGRFSVFSAAHRLGLPITVHVGIGTDIISQQPSFNAAELGKASHTDFRILADICGAIDRGGVIANVGSAVILPEVFLKALTVSRNIKKGRSRLTSANFDMITHYRPTVNVVDRPTLKAGKGFNFVGHHEIMIPLLAWGLKRKYKR